MNFFTPEQLFKRFDVLKDKLDMLAYEARKTIDAFNAPEYFGLSDEQAMLRSEYLLDELTEMVKAIDRSGLYHMTFGEE